MRRLALRIALSLAVAGTSSASPLVAQGLEGQIGRFYQGGGWTLYRLGVNRPLGSVFGIGVEGIYLERIPGDGGFAGLGADLTAFKGGRQGFYLVAGVNGGLGSDSTSSFSKLWSSWSAGIGYELFPTSFLAFDAEGRWRELSSGRREGFQLSAGLSIRFGSGGSRSRTERPRGSSEAPLDPPRAAEPGVVVSDLGASPAVPARSASRGRTAVLADSIIETALEVMGRKYQWGGTGENGQGFDCSGLIQYAYAQYGLSLPRRSVDQAREGRDVSKRLDALAPGDLLTFSNRGGPVTHIGLYIGNGRFIHSASHGVQVSTLSAEDPYGRWWFKRWVGARRILTES